MSDVTQILLDAQRGDARAAGEFLEHLYGELRKLAASQLAKEKPGLTLQATALVHEAFLRIRGQLLASGSELSEADRRAYFFAAAAQAMRRILIEAARHKARIKHGGRHAREEIDFTQIECEMPNEELLDLHEALEELAIDTPEKAKLVELRFFAGLNQDDAAEVLKISPATAKRHWRYARAWLAARLNHQIAPSGEGANDG